MVKVPQMSSWIHMNHWMSRAAVVALGSMALGGCLLAGQATADPTITGNLTIEIDGLSNQEGQVCISLFSSSRGFPGDNSSAVRGQCVTIGSSPLMVTLADVQLGNYAIAVIHDENSDQTLNRNAIGIPTEGFGFSRNPAIFAGPPEFGDSALLVAGNNTDVQIQLKYLLGK